jgi:hypothetical protein
MLRLIKPEDISFEWERVRAGLAVIKEATTDDWLPEDIYMAIRMNNAALYIGEDDHGDYLGFLIMQVLPMFHGQKLHLWCAYSATKQPLMRRFFPEIQKIAQQVKAKKISFSSLRGEWEAAAPRLGFKPAQTTYEFEL